MTTMTPPSSPSRNPTNGKWIWWILLPLLFGAATLALVYNTEEQEMEIAIGVSFINLADDLLLMDARQHSVRLLLTGTPSALKTIDPQLALCRLDLTGLGEGTHTIPMKRHHISLPKGIALQTLLTPALTIQLEAVTQKTVGVVAVLEGNPAPGFAVPSVKLIPDRIVLEGTATMLAGIDTVNTRPINLEAASESFKKEVPLSLPEAIAVNPPLRIVVAEVVVKERIVTRVMENIPVSGKGASVDHQIHPPAITLTVIGPEAIVNAIESDPAFAVTIDLNGLTPGIHTLKAAINLPVQTALVQVSPERFSVTIRK